MSGAWSDFWNSLIADSQDTKQQPILTVMFALSAGWRDGRVAVSYITHSIITEKVGTGKERYLGSLWYTGPAI